VTGPPAVRPRRAAAVGGLAASRAAAAPAVLTATWVTTAVLSLAGAVLTVVAWNHLADGDKVSSLGGALSAVLYATLGTLIVRRAGNVVGWLLLGVGAGLAVMTAAGAYGVAGLTHPGTVPAPELVGLLAELCFIPVLGGFIATFLLFPDGRLPSPRWRPVAWLGLLAAALALAGFTVHPRMVGLPAPGGVSVRFPNPLGVDSLGPVGSTVLVGTQTGLGLLVLPFFAAAVTALVVRYRSGGRDVRQQIKWLAFMMAAEFASAAVVTLGLAAHGGAQNPVADVGSVVSAGVALIGVPAVVTLAILKHRLYQIDVIINKTVKYGLLSAALTGVYAAIVVGIGTLAVLLRLLEDAATDPGEVRLLTAQLRDGLHAALDDLRALARGIYPPLLAEQGLLEALQAQARRVPLPVSVEADGIGRYQRDTEATAYFCILEALQNVAKYARATRATVALACPDGQLEFSVTDDGVGFDTAAALSGTGPDGTGPRGTGLQGMADRLAAAGGSFHLRSGPGLGTTVRGRLPA